MQAALIADALPQRADAGSDAGSREKKKKKKKKVRRAVMCEHERARKECTVRRGGEGCAVPAESVGCDLRARDAKEPVPSLRNVVDL